MLGPLSVALNDSSTIAIDPESGMLLLIQFEPDTGTNAVYVVDTTTGRATLVGALGCTTPIAAIALAPPLPDDIFAGNFD